MRTKDFNETDILRKAIALFWQKGYHATSLHDLIDGLEIGRSSIYHAFGDKHNLFLQALELYQQEATAKIQALLNDAFSVKEAVTHLLQQVVNDVFTDACPKGCFKINSEVEMAASDEVIKKLVAEDDLIIEKALYNAIKKGQADGEISISKNPKALARFICNAIAGMRVYGKFRNDRQFFDDIVKTTLSVLD
ncbi:TetR/AcrR family transcriptional regulator [Mucilaginibacter robiniae]|uniref:TetR/AcrR family transcriptional regulator n=1 Tax=Mucilaginibacter robiniae TaxID=2728022 RepID=A0A7L5E096_9SPHI|nr:TetR/AcrR family transcriptional regulator [Mucilaginibacter robiniae]QJD96655.1 TetR/AcrR family transcriptional regulator [Mucilaginibacter robiniae]